MPRGRLPDGLGVDLGHHQRHVGVHPERAGLVDHDHAAGGRHRRPVGRHLVGHVEHGQVHAVEGLGGQLLDLDLLAADRRACARPTGPRRSAGPRPTRRPWSRRCPASRCRPRRSRRRWPGPVGSPLIGRSLRTRRPARSPPPSSNARGWRSTADADVVLVHDHRDPDLRGGDHLDVDARLGQRAEERGAHAGIGPHARADQGDLADPVVVEQGVEADLVAGARPARSWPPGRRRAAA